MQCKVTVIADSISRITGKRITTFEFEFPRIVLAEFNTHNAVSKNASSSRAIPVPSQLKQVRENPAFPVRFGAANKGMQDNGEHNQLIQIDDGGFRAQLTPEQAWANAAHSAAERAQEYHEAGYAKQICNRLIEPFQMMKVVATATEWNNFLWLRDHDAADPTIAQLAALVKEALANSTPVELDAGDWHVPYYNDGVWKETKERTFLTVNRDTPVDKFGHSLDHALTISSSCCAQVSFRSLDDTLEKAKRVVERLNLNGEEPDQPVHASPLEHQGTPIKAPCGVLGINGLHPASWQEGITHMDRDGMFGSGNLKGFIQHRQLVPNHVKRG